jgi:hypothetical protein
MDSLNDIEKQVFNHIKSCMKRGQQFFKAKHIAHDIGLSSHEVGTNLMMMSKKNLGDMKILNYASTTSTTWKVIVNDRCIS